MIGIYFSLIISGLMTTASLASLTRNQIMYPYFSEVSPCSCDLTTQKCDVYCCCDPDCSEEAKLEMPCISGLRGGFDEGKLPAYNCSSNIISEPWCIYSHNSPYLGLYYEYETSADDYSDNLEYFSFKEPDFGPEEDERNREGAYYVYGSEIETVYDLKDGIFGHAHLPANSLNGQCLISAPIQFLKDRRSSCLRILTPEVCDSGKRTSLDYQMFFITSPRKNVGSVPEVLKRSGLNAIAPMRVTYYSAKNPDIYTKSKIEKSRNFFFKFLDEDAFVLPNIQSQIFFDREDLSCINVVLEVHYLFYWKGNSIEKVQADILLANNSVSNETELEQIFQVKFQHINGTGGVPLSGNPGYETGKPVIVATSINDTTDFGVITGNLRHWPPHGSCYYDSGTKPSVNFLENSISECFLELSKVNFSDCSVLQQSVEDLQLNLLSPFPNGSLSVAKGGNPNDTIDDFIDAIFDLKPSPLPTVLSSNKNPHSCFVNSHFHLQFLFTEDLKIRRINGLRISSHPELWEWVRFRSKFLLRITVDFAEIPLRASNISRFWAEQDIGYCWRDICWNELMYPFTHHHRQIGDSVIYSTQWGITLSILALSLMYITREYW